MQRARHQQLPRQSQRRIAKTVERSKEDRHKAERNREAVLKPERDLAREQFDVEFVASGRGKARCAPDPVYPHGKAIQVASEAQPSCVVELPYPAPECGHFMVRCKLCEFSLAVTASGRPDDPTKITMPCQLFKGETNVVQ